MVDAVNRQVAAYGAETKRLEDGLHLRPAAYVEFTRILKPVLTRAFE